MLTLTTDWLAEQGIEDAEALEGACFGDLEGAEQWPAEARNQCLLLSRTYTLRCCLQVGEFLEGLMQTHRRKRRYIPACILEGSAAARCAQLMSALTP